MGLLIPLNAMFSWIGVIVDRERRQRSCRGTHSAAADRAREPLRRPRGDRAQLAALIAAAVLRGID
jgi:hypothetical protein